MATTGGVHDHEQDTRNADVLVWVNGELTPRAEAVVSVFDSGFVLGDGSGRACGSTTGTRRSSSGTWIGSSRAPRR